MQRCAVPCAAPCCSLVSLSLLLAILQALLRLRRCRCSSCYVLGSIGAYWCADILRPSAVLASVVSAAAVALTIPHYCCCRMCHSISQHAPACYSMTQHVTAVATVISAASEAAGAATARQEDIGAASETIAAAPEAIV